MVTGVSKRFGGIPALCDVSLRVRRGEVHALIGENGAGKSTLGKIIAGVISPDAGLITLGSRHGSFSSPRDALSSGVVTIAQELAIVPALSVADNVFLGSEISSRGIVHRRRTHDQFRRLTERAGFDLKPETVAGSLSTADQQKVEILRALARNAKVVIMDEPSAALSSYEVEALHGVIRSLSTSGTSVVLISHFLSEVLSLSDTITTLRDGRWVSTVAAEEATESSLIEGMLGRTLNAAFPSKSPAPESSPVVLDVRGVYAAGVEDCTFQVRRGEIVGIAGLVGAGRSELARAIVRDARIRRGDVHLDGSVLSARSPRGVLQRGVALIPESRKELGLLMNRSIRENVALSSLEHVSRWGWLQRRRERSEVDRMMAETTVKAASMEMSASLLSGGNQQKLLFARTLLVTPKVLIADEPTRGVDVGSKRAIYDLLVDLAQRGLGVIVISSELDEVLGLAHRVLVMRHGTLVAELTGDQMTQRNVLAAAFDESRAA